MLLMTIHRAVLFSSIVTLSVGFTPGVRAQTHWFKAPVMLEGVPGDLRLLGDIDGDHDLDAVTFTGVFSFTPLFNDGLGRFTAGPTVTLPANTGPNVAMGDFDGDGIADLVTTGLNSSPLGAALLIHLGVATGQFAAPIVLPLPGNVAQLLRGTADGDGIDDLLVMHFNSAANMETRWLHGDPTRTFPLGPSSTAIGFAHDAAVVRVDSDGIDDLVTVIDNTPGPDAVAVWVTTPTGFAAQGSLPIRASVGGAQLLPIDLDGDGDRDLLAIALVANRTLQITRLRHDAGATWVFDGSQTFTNTSLGERWFAGDWDGNGIDDVLERESGTGSGSGLYHQFSIWRNDGTGVLTRMTTQVIPDLSSQSQGGAGAADFDGDGKLDFADNTALVFGDGTFASPFGPQMVSTFDWDDDGDAGSFPSGLLGLNDGTGVLVEHDLGFPPPPNGQIYSFAQVITDLDHDGFHEALVARSALLPFQPAQFIDMRLFREAPGLAFVDVGPAAAPGQQMTGRTLADDADGDGDVDVITRQGVWFNNGTGFFTLTGPGFGSYEPCQLVDFDGDGNLDFLGAKFDGGTSLAVFHRTAPATYVPTILYTGTSTQIQTPGYAVADLDDDGDPDLVGAEVVGGQAHFLLFENQGGVLSLRTTLQRSGSVAAGDVDGDGRTDLCVGSDYRLYVLRRNGPWTYDEPVVFAFDFFFTLADVDQDGDLDACGQSTIQNRRF